MSRSGSLPRTSMADLYHCASESDMETASQLSMRSIREGASQLSVLMAGLRGSNIDSSDFADSGVVMQLISVSESDGETLPLTYDPTTIAEYWSRRPVSVLTRIMQLLGVRCTCC